MRKLLNKYPIGARCSHFPAPTNDPTHEIERKPFNSQSTFFYKYLGIYIITASNSIRPLNGLISMNIIKV